MKQRDIELLSSYLDGQLSSADSARLEARLRTDPEMRSVLQDLRGARSLLRQLPMRKAPRNFTLTPKMVGKNPPLPRSYPVFKFSATLATILLFFTMGLNVLESTTGCPACRVWDGRGRRHRILSWNQLWRQRHRRLLPHLLQPSRRQPREAAIQAPLVGMAPPSTATAAAEDANSTRVMETAVSKQSDTEAANAASSGLAQQPPQAAAEPAPEKPVSPVWQWLLAGIALISLVIMALMRQLSASRWRSRS